MRNPTDVLNSLSKQSKNPTYKFQRLYRNLYNPEFYLLAYKNIYANEGRMTPGVDGETLDGMSGSPEKVVQKQTGDRREDRSKSRVCLNRVQPSLTRLTHPCSGMRDGMHAQRECRLSSRKHYVKLGPGGPET